MSQKERTTRERLLISDAFSGRSSFMDGDEVLAAVLGMATDDEEPEAGDTGATGATGADGVCERLPAMVFER